MKCILLFFSLIFYSFSFSRLTVDAGKDTSMCVTWYATSVLELGGLPTASGGTPPYTYIWETNYTVVFGSTTYLLTASDFLSDTTIANPNVITTKDDPAEFILTVIDSNGLTIKDTIIVSFYVFGTHSGEVVYNLLAGDSIMLSSTPNVSHGTEPSTYLWRPNHGLIDSLSYINFWIKPTTSTHYYLTVTNSVGCIAVGTPVFHVYVGYLNIDELLYSDNESITIYPNPSTESICLNKNGVDVLDVTIFDINNKYIENLDLKKIKFDLSSYSKGVYIVKIKTSNGFVSKKIVLK